MSAARLVYAYLGKRVPSLGTNYYGTDPSISMGDPAYYAWLEKGPYLETNQSTCMIVIIINGLIL